MDFVAFSHPVAIMRRRHGLGSERINGHLGGVQVCPPAHHGFLKIIAGGCMNRFKGRMYLSIAVIALLFFSAPASAQIIFGAISGRALDNSGALIPGVEITITSPAMIG